MSAPLSTRPRPQPVATPPPPPVGPRAVRRTPAPAMPPAPPPLPAIDVFAEDVPQPRPRVDSVSAPPTYDSLPATSEPFQQRSSGPRVLVVDDNAITQHLLVGCLRRNGCRVQGTRDPRDATRSSADSYDLVVLSAELTDPSPLDVARYLQEYHPEQWVVLAGTSALDTDAQSLGIREVIAVPSGFERLGELVDLLRGELALRESLRPADPEAIDMTVLDALRADDPQVIQETIELFLGQTPESLARVAESHARADAKAVQAECRTLCSSARALGANHLARLAHAAAELVGEGDLEHVPGFVTEMEREYGLVFRALMDVHAAADRSSGGIR